MIFLIFRRKFNILKSKGKIFIILNKCIGKLVLDKLNIF